MGRGTYFGHVTEHAALELSARAGRSVYFGRTEWAGADGRYDVIVECPQDEPEDSPVPGDLLRLALSLVTDLLSERPAHATPDLDAISRMVAESSPRGEHRRARRRGAPRGIPVRRVGGLSLLRLGHGCHRRLVWAALTEQTSAVGVDIASDKVLAKQLLAGAGVPVPEGMVATTAAQAAEAFTRIGRPVVIKPRNGNHGSNVTVGVTSATDAIDAYRRASVTGLEVIVEEYVPGTDYRVLIVDGRMVAAARLRPASVTGDGCHDIASLVALANADPGAARVTRCR